MNKNSCHYSLSYRYLKECHQLPSCTGLIRRYTAPLWRQVNLKPGCQIWAAQFTQPQRQWSLLPLLALHPGKRDRPPLTRSTKFIVFTLPSAIIVAVLSWRHWVYCNDLCLENKTESFTNSWRNWTRPSHVENHIGKDNRISSDCLHWGISLKSVLSWLELKSWQLRDKSQERGKLLSKSQSHLAHKEPSVTGLDLLTPSLPLCFHKWLSTVFLSWLTDQSLGK